MVVDRDLGSVVQVAEAVLVVLEELVEELLELLLLVLLQLLLLPSVLSMSSEHMVPICIYLEVCCVLDLLHSCISGMTITPLKNALHCLLYCQNLGLHEASRCCQSPSRPVPEPSM